NPTDPFSMRLGDIDHVRRSCCLAAIQPTGPWKKFPIAARKRCSSTLPESSTWPTQEPPLKFDASCAASSPDGTPLSSSKLISDWLAAELIQGGHVDGKSTTESGRTRMKPI